VRLRLLSPVLDCALTVVPRPTGPLGGYTLNVWDVGGQTTIRSYWKNYFEQTDGLIWVVDCADRRRLADCRDELAGLLAQEKLAGASVLILANKQDLTGALPADDIAEALDLRSAGAFPVANSSNVTLVLCAYCICTYAAFSKRHWHIQPCSAVTGDGLVPGVDWLVRDIAARVFLSD
jgi:ADP-ribosylation factor-like protein 2